MKRLFVLAVFSLLCALIFPVSPAFELLKEGFFWKVRVIPALGAFVSGASMALAGDALQSSLENPLASPLTLGLSSGAMLGACLSTLIFSEIRIIFPIFFSAVVVLFIFAIGFLKGFQKESLILAGIAVGSFFSSLATASEFFLNNQQISQVVYWMFGDPSRITQGKLLTLTLIFALSFAAFVVLSPQIVTLNLGKDVAESLGVNVGALRFLFLFISSVLVAFCVSFVGVIGFVGLVVPNAARTLAGWDFRRTVFFSALLGASFTALSFSFGKAVFPPYALPTGVVTALWGAPAFALLILRGRYAS